MTNPSKNHVRASQRLRALAEVLRSELGDAAGVELLADEVERIEEQLDARGPCAYCGGPNPRGGDYCSDAHRAAYHREHMPVGVVKSARRLARDRASVVVHFEPDEADRAVRLLVGERVYIGQDLKPGRS